MMTLHNGKGLEFSVVFLVGMTRAKEVLFLTCSAYRYLWGMPRTMRPSRFLRLDAVQHV